MSCFSSGSKWSDEAADDFERLTHCAQWKELQAEIVDNKEVKGHLVPVVELVDTSGEEDVNIGHQMVRLGHATFTSGHGAENGAGSEEVTNGN